MGVIEIRCQCKTLIEIRPHRQNARTYITSTDLCSRCLQARRSAARPESERLIRRLHLLDSTGQDEVPEANVIRARMVELDRDLTPEDRQKIEQISVELWAEYDRSKGRESPKTQEETDWLAPITNEKLQQWEEEMREGLLPTYSEVRRLIAEVRALRGHLYPPTVTTTDRITSPALE